MIRAYIDATTKAVTRAVIPAHSSQMWYGVRINEANSSPDLERIGNFMGLHALLPVQNNMKACLKKDDGAINYYLDPTDWSKKADGSASNLDGTDGQVLIEVNEYWRKVDSPASGIYDHKISHREIHGWQYVPKFYIGAYEASVQRSTKKLASVVNATADYRGGNNNAAWDAAANTLLGKPASLLPLENGTENGFRRYARNRNGDTKWNVATWRMNMLLYELYMIEYATLHTQKTVNATLTTEGYKQGGLGAGVTNAVAAEWNTFSSNYSFVNCGESNALGSGTGETSLTIPNFGGVGVDRTFTIPRYRGIENIFGNIWEFLDGASVFHEAAGGVSKFYTCDNPANFADNTADNYDYRSNLPLVNTYIKQMTHDENGVFIPLSGGTGSGYNTYFCDYYTTPGLINAWRACLRGGAANAGANAGFGSLNTNVSASLTDAGFGARLTYIP